MSITTFESPIPCPTSKWGRIYILPQFGLVLTNVESGELIRQFQWQTLTHLTIKSRSNGLVSLTEHHGGSRYRTNLVLEPEDGLDFLFEMIQKCVNVKIEKSLFGIKNKKCIFMPPYAKATQIGLNITNLWDLFEAEDQIDQSSENHKIDYRIPFKQNCALVYVSKQFGLLLCSGTTGTITMQCQWQDFTEIVIVDREKGLLSVNSFRGHTTYTLNLEFDDSSESDHFLELLQSCTHAQFDERKTILKSMGPLFWSEPLGVNITNVSDFEKMELENRVRYESTSTNKPDKNYYRKVRLILLSEIRTKSVQMYSKTL